MAERLVEILIIEGIAVLMFIFAYLIGVRGKFYLIAGYNAQTAFRVKDKGGLKRLITRLCILLGIESATMPILAHFTSSYHHGFAYIIGGCNGFLLGVIGMVALQSRDYTS